jgi:hypothetical protein
MFSKETPPTMIQNYMKGCSGITQTTTIQLKRTFFLIAYLNANRIQTIIAKSAVPSISAAAIIIVVLASPAASG